MFKTKYLKSLKILKTLKIKSTTSKNIKEIKEILLIQLYDFKSEAEISLIFLIKSERTGSLFYDPYKIFKTVFEILYSLFVKSELSLTLNIKMIIRNKSEETDSSVKKFSDSKPDSSDFKLSIKISLELKNLENFKNIIKIDTKQFVEVLKEVKLFQKLIELEDFYRKVEKDLLDFLKKFEK